jgi:hypothetical protein
MIYHIGFFLFSVISAFIFMHVKMLTAFTKLINSYKETLELLRKETSNLDHEVMRLASKQFKLIGTSLLKMLSVFLPLVIYILALDISGIYYNFLSIQSILVSLLAFLIIGLIKNND